MKKLVTLALSLTTFSTQAQSLWSAFNDYQNSLSNASPSSTATSSSSEVRADNSGGSTSSARQCTTNDQSSLPLSVVTSLILEKDGKLEITHDASTGELMVQVPRMVGNCSEMIEWKVKKPTIRGKVAYAIEASIKQGESCNNSLCNYRYANVVDGDFKGWETKAFAPSLKGFEECLKASGVIQMVSENGKQVPKPNPRAIYPMQLREKRTGLTESGELFFLSSGPSSVTIGPKYARAFSYIDGCDHYESAHPQITELLTSSDQEKRRLDAEAARLKDCKAEEYGKLSEFIEKYEGYASQLGSVRDRLILEAAKKAAKNISEGKYTDDDLKIFTDFERYVVQPKVNQAIKLYEEAMDTTGEEQKAKQRELQAVLAEISALNQKPYFEASHLQKLIADGKFQDAEKLNGIQLTLTNYTRLGQQIQNVKYTPQVVASNVTEGRKRFAVNLEREKEKYMYRTGQSVGNARFYAQEAQRLYRNIEIRTRNFNAEIMQEKDYCTKFFWRNNMMSCRAESERRRQQLEADLAKMNADDLKLAQEAERAALEWKALEDQGQRYLAGDTSTPANTPNPSSPSTASSTPTAPAQRQDSGVYSFDFNQPQPPQPAQFIPYQSQFPMQPSYNQNMFQQQNPYAYYPSNIMGQFSYGINQNPYGYQSPGVYNFGWGGAMPQGIYGSFGATMGASQGFWQNPYPAYDPRYSYMGR
jgi:hypothetical protein